MNPLTSTRALLALTAAVFGILYFFFADTAKIPLPAQSAQSADDGSAVVQGAKSKPLTPVAQTDALSGPNAPPATPIESPNVANHWSATSLVSALKRSSSYRLFVLEALQTPEKGGVFYAQKVIFGCTQANDALLAAAKASIPGRAAALTEFNSRCDITLEQLNALVQKQPDILKRDPLLGMMNGLASNQADIKRKTLSDALKTQDPMLLFESPALSFSRRVQSGSDGSGEKVLTYFNGKWLSEADAAPFRYAQKLAACDFGLPCQQNDLWLSNLCVTGNECAYSRQEYMERFVYPNQPAWRAKIEQYRSEIKEAVKTQTVAAFVPAH